MTTTPEHITKYRAYMKVIARQQLPRVFAAKFDSSDVVQDTLLQMVEVWDERIDPLNEAARQAYVRAMLINRLTDAIRHYKRDKRNIDLESSLHEGANESSQRLEKWLGNRELLPEENLDQSEAILNLCFVIDKLPLEQRLAIELHHLGGLSLAETAENMNKSVASVAGLLRRALQELRAELKPRE